MMKTRIIEEKKKTSGNKKRLRYLYMCVRYLDKWIRYLDRKMIIWFYEKTCAIKKYMEKIYLYK
jgi:hypothetical protein